MEETCRHVRYLTFQEVKDINEETIVQEGGFAAGAGKLFNPNSLHYVIVAVQSKLFGMDLYPSMHLKAALYAHHIITRHIFIDGNKRTGLKAAFFFLRINDFHQFQAIAVNELVAIAIGIAEGKIDLSEITSWLEKKFAK